MVTVHKHDSGHDDSGHGCRIEGLDVKQAEQFERVTGHWIQSNFKWGVDIK